MKDKEIKIELRPILNNMWDGDTVVLLTTNPQESLDEWLTAHYAPLKRFKFKASFNQRPHQLQSKDNPEFQILIRTFYVNPTHPRNVLQFGEPRQWRPSPSPRKK